MKSEPSDSLGNQIMVGDTIEWADSREDCFVYTKKVLCLTPKQILVREKHMSTWRDPSTVVVVAKRGTGG